MGVKLRERELPSGKVQLYLDIYRGGRRQFEALGMFYLPERGKDAKLNRFHNKETEKQAKAIEAKRQLDFQSEMYGIIGTHNRRSSFITYIETLKDSHTSENTRLSWGNAIEQLKDFAGEMVTFGDLSRKFFEEFKAHLLNNNVSPNSAQVYLARIKTALNQAVRDNILAFSPARDVTIRKQDRLPVFLTLEEVKKLSDTPCGNDQVKRAFIFACFTGLRYSDVDRLTWDKVRGEYLTFEQEKTGSAERLPLSPEAQRILQEQKTAAKNPNLNRQLPENVVFFLPSQPVLDKQLKKWAKAAELGKTISFHKARHTFATLSLSSGNDLYVTSKLLGHKNIQTTQIYARVIDEKKKEAVAKLPTLR